VFIRRAALGLLLAAAGGCAYLVRDAAVFYMKVNAELTGTDIEISIDETFIQRYMDRVSITTHFTVDRARATPHSRYLDGDLHFAGRAPEVGLPAVAEIANAASAMPAVDLVNRFAGTGRPLRITGVWRIWAEHARREEEKQGEDVPPEASHNPGHVFEIHPVTKIGALRLENTFRTIEGFIAGEARKTFAVYENVECRIAVKGRQVAIVTRKGIYNNVEYLMEVADSRQREVEGGRFVMASVRDLKGDLLVNRVRMVFADDTPPERAVRLLKRGGRLHVYGLPRINLAEIWRRVKDSRSDPALLTKPLPYEIIVQGVYENK
jgi:hypothetical protein